MLQEFWNHFMTTGCIDDYLKFKAYERDCLNKADDKLSGNSHEVG